MRNDLSGRRLRDGNLFSNRLRAGALLAFAGLAAFVLPAAAPAATIPVFNCSDSGPGSLRGAIAEAASGDTIDMSTLACDLTVGTTLLITQDSLTIKGKEERSFGFPVTGLKGGSARQVLRHTGTGTLALEWMTVSYGFEQANEAEAMGGCVESAGKVSLTDTAVVICEAHSNYGMAMGGAVYAAGDVDVFNSLVANGKALGTDHGARGGGIYSGGTVYLAGNSVVRGNQAEAGGNWSIGADGGGIFAATGFLAGEGTEVFANIAVGGASVSQGGGVFTQGGFVGAVTIESNKADYGGGMWINDFLFGAPVVVDNEAMVDGGGIFATNLSLTDAYIAENTANGNGGGLRVQAELILDRTRVYQNTAQNGMGGNVDVWGDVTISNSTISDGYAKEVGGASLGGASWMTRTIIIDQSTISRNNSYASERGAGLYLMGNARIRNSTITDNTEVNSADNRWGAGIALAGGVELELSSSIVSDNRINRSNSTTVASDIGMAKGASNATLTGSHNLIGTFAYAGFALTPSSIQTNDPQLGALQNNGGGILTHLPKPTSAAIDNGLANGFSADQRGPAYARSVGGGADIGATERQDSDIIFRHGFDF